jgi:hypothetical protein
MQSAIARLRGTSYAVLLASLGCGAALLPMNAQLSLVALAVVFGWSQIGGL